MGKQAVSSLKNIIFDLGGVLLDIDYQLTAEAFKDLGVCEFHEYYGQYKQTPLFDQFETGQISPEHFRQALCQNLQVALSQDSFDRAWNAMILKFKPQIFDFVEQLRKTYRVFLFSNTNSIHYQRFHRILKRDLGLAELDAYFEAAYYSHILGMRKPDPASYQKILQLHNLSATETLFIDDTSTNIAGAKEAGLWTWHLTPQKSIFQLEQAFAEIFTA